MSQSSQRVIWPPEEPRYCPYFRFQKWMKIPIFLSFSVPSLSKARRQPTSYHVATAQEVQKPHNSRLQELGCGHHQYVTSKHKGILHIQKKAA